MFVILNRKRLIRDVTVFIMVISVLVGCIAFIASTNAVKTSGWQEGELIKWVDFNVPYEALSYAIKLDIKYHESKTPVNFIELLAFLAAKNGNNFKSFKTQQLDALVEKLEAGESINELTAEMKYYNYYHEVFTATLSGLVGTYDIEVKDETTPSGVSWDRKYGIMAFSPIAKNYYYNDSDDFGNSRSYGFKRRHLGHDMMGSIGTPIIAVEGGIVEELGWNQYGGWRIGIRTKDTKRYYYYAHLRKNFPYNKSLQVGSVVNPGDVIGYMGKTGYSTTENVNGMQKTHLHIGLQLVFDESQKECDNEIWIDIYPIIQLLSRYRSEVVKDPETKEYSRVFNFKEVETE